MVIFSYPDGSKPESKILMLNRDLLYRTRQGDKAEEASVFIADEKPAQYVMSKRGNPLLVVDNYLYRKNGQTGKNGQQYWVCISPQCSVRTKTLNERVNSAIATHSHPPQPQYVEQLRTAGALKMASISRGNEISGTWEDVLVSNLSEDLVTAELSESRSNRTRLTRSLAKLSSEDDDEMGDVS
ncbi:uncharacterized protein LOC100909081 [Galendromus occidentalis]|uniref:Uncharacterized protein LOC100909081 n=1 Tax=Galendromus occidentalis TaxID=34638 RepID=A0AAJ6QUD0_9ACAR|nr:uncharacterized protein LOC100909081 [Galendromus occidentalis]